MPEIQCVDIYGSPYVVPIEAYPDGMPLIRTLGAPVRMLVRAREIHSFVAAMFCVDALTWRGLGVPELILPNFPGARQDRLTKTGDMLFTAKSIAQMVNVRRFPLVTLLDPHSDVTPALLDRCRVVSAADCIVTPAGKYAAVVSPDAGAEKRAGAVAQKLGLPLLRAWKTREVATGAISGFGMQESGLPTGSLVLVVDDICDGGGTFVGLMDAIDAQGLKAHLWVTHGIFSKGTGDLLKRFGHVYCSDSYIGDRQGIVEINVCEQLLLKGTL